MVKFSFFVFILLFIYLLFFFFHFCNFFTMLQIHIQQMLHVVEWSEWVSECVRACEFLCSSSDKHPSTSEQTQVTKCSKMNAPLCHSTSDDDVLLLLLLLFLYTPTQRVQNIELYVLLCDSCHHNWVGSKIWGCFSFPSKPPLPLACVHICTSQTHAYQMQNQRTWQQH